MTEQPDHPDFQIPILGAHLNRTKHEQHIRVDNNGNTPSMTSMAVAVRMGKFFPRGMRGFLDTIEVYCENIDVAAQTITVYVSPTPELGYKTTAVINLAGGAAAAWRVATFNAMWQFDSMFIWLQASSGNVHIGYDTDHWFDYYVSTDGGFTWDNGDQRLWIRVNLTGATVGDVPVSGTLNTVEVPHIGAQSTSGAISVSNNNWTIILQTAGAGTLLQAKLNFATATTPTAAIYYALRVYADGVLAYEVDNRDLTQSPTAASGACSEGEFYQLASNTILNLRMPVKFRRQIEIRAYQNTGGAVDTTGRIEANHVR